MISKHLKGTLFLSAFIICILSILSGFSFFSHHHKANSPEKTKIITGAEQVPSYLSLLKGKSCAVVANQTTVIKKISSSTHLVDSLLSLGISIKRVFSPEHGFRGNVDAGKQVSDGVDNKTNLPIISLYGKNKKPTNKQLEGIEYVIFDIQDVGVRFYTYISTLHYVMEACAENKIPLLLLDRPNPNGHYVDGPTLDSAFKSFVGMHPVPLVYGMTIGEYAQMINGEKWLSNGVRCELKVIKLQGYTHQSTYDLPIKPSPNLPNKQAVNLYPSLGFFEGTTINAGRGTQQQFQRYGAPFFPKSKFTYTPKSLVGAKYPKHENLLCYGVDLSTHSKMSSVRVNWLIDAYKKTPKTQSFFGKTFTIHAGSENLQKQIEAGLDAETIRKSWQNDIRKFKKIRKKYLIYP